MNQDLDLSNFTAGELSPRILGRIDVSKYYNGAETCLNMVPLPQGGATRRPGTMLAALANDQSNPARLVPFQFSTVQDYVLEFSNGSLRFYMNHGLILSGGSPVQITVPYQAADLRGLWTTQSADTLYIFHPNYPPAILQRFSHTNWQYQVSVFRDGPYKSLNVTQTTLAASATTGTVTVTAGGASITNAQNNGSGIIRLTSANHGFTNKSPIIVAGVAGTTEANGSWSISVVDGNTFDLVGSIFSHAYTSGGTVTLSTFASTDVGRMLRMKVSSNWGWLIITGYASPTQVTALVQAAVNGGAQGALDGTTATLNWQLGKWGKTLNAYPETAIFFQQRLLCSGTNDEPGAIEASLTSDFTNFAPTAADGAVAATNALSWIISDDQVNATHWLSAAGSAQTAQLGIGTAAGEAVMQPASTTAALSATNVQVYRETSYGSASNVGALRIGKSVLFANRPGRKVHEWTFSWTVNGYLGPDLTIFAEHVTRSGIIQMAYQQSPYSVVWAVLANGGLIGMTYLKEQEINAWHRHQLGGQYYGGPPRVESIAVIPSPDGSYDELWCQVLRTINGVPTRTVEVMTRYFDAQPTEQACFVDCAAATALTSPAATLTAASANGNGVAFHLSVGQSFAIGGFIRANGGIAVIRTLIDASDFTADWLLASIDVAPQAAGSWTYGPPLTSISGLSYLNGETVQLLGDGADLGTAVPVGGAVALSSPSTYVLAGLPYTSELMTMPLEPQSAAAALTAGRVKNISTLYLRLLESLGCNYGVQTTDDFTDEVNNNIEPLQTRSAANPLGSAPPLFTGVRRLQPPGGFDQEAQIIINTTGPMPLTVLSIGVSYDVGDTAG